jgi:hypothetical protein
MQLLQAPARPRAAPRSARLPGFDLRRAAPTVLAGVLAAVYVIVSPPSLDLAAHLLRAKLFGAEGFGTWNNWWYAGHNTPGYSVLFPPLAWALTPQLVGAISAVISAALFEALAYRRFGRHGWLGATWFGLATATDLYTGRLTFAFGVMLGVAAALALQRRRPWWAAGLAVLTALASPVAALFVALAGAAYGLAHRRNLGAGAGTVVAALVPVLALAALFPEGGNEPFIFMTLWPLPLICAAAVYAFPRRDRAIRIGAVIYALACVAAYLVPTPAGSNVSRLAPLIGGPLAALALWPERKRLLLVVAVPLLYIQLQAPIRDLSTSSGQPSTTAGYYQPLLSFLGRQSGPPFRIEIPFTGFHWEAYEVAPRFPLARGWERQLDLEYNSLFYQGTLTAARYRAWLHQLAIRFVAVSDAPLDYSAHQEAALIDRGLPYLHLVDRTAHWHIYAVRDPTPIVQGDATLTGLGPDWVALHASRAGSALVRVRWSPYWAISGGPGCVAPEGDFMRVTVRRAEKVRIVTRFSLLRAGSRSARCSG